MKELLKATKELDRVSGNKTVIKVDYQTNTFKIKVGTSAIDTFKIKPGKMDEYIKIRTQRIRVNIDLFKKPHLREHLALMNNTLAMQAMSLYDESNTSKGKIIRI